MRGGANVLSSTTVPAIRRPCRRIAGLLVAAVVSLIIGGVVPGYSQGIPDVVAAVRPSVAFVLAKGESQVSGSAFVVEPNGLLITALHVVEDASEVSVVFPGGDPEPADVIQIDPPNDLALLRVAQANLAAIETAGTGETRVGEEVIVVGYPLARELGHYDVTVTRGIVSALRTRLGLIQVDASMNPGVSGGPVLTANGQVVGVAVAGIPGAQGVNFAAPVDAVRVLLAKSLESSTPAAPLTLPLSTVASVDIVFHSGGIGSGPTKFEHGLSCVQPPDNASVLSRVEGELDTDNALNVVTWLSLGGGGVLDGRNTFAYIDGVRQTHASVTAGGLHLPLVKVCLNYGAANVGLLPLGLTFRVKYTLSYKIRPSATP